MECPSHASHLAKVVAAVLLLVAANVPAIGGENGRAASLPDNKWTVLSEDGPLSRHGRMTWLPDAKRILVWPNWHPRAGKGSQEKTARLHFFNPAGGAWSTKASDLSKDKQPIPQTVASPYIYLPGLKKVLFLTAPWHKRGPRSWLLDPAAGKWEGIATDLEMSNSPRECGVPPAVGCYPVPAWGTLCYDAHNREVMSLGGGGVWGRIDVAKEKVAVGDWIFDEKIKRVRRLIPAEEGKITEARRWYPGHCGAWTFSEKTGKWTAVAQPMSQQPSGRVLPGMAYDPVARKIVAFGGDDLTRCLADTWIYDCKTKKWSQAKPKSSPAARAGHAMLYVPDQKTILMAGGYGTGWQPLSDTWAYDVAKSEWTQLGISLPAPTFYCSAVYAPEKKAVLVRYDTAMRGYSKKITLCGLKLNLSSAGRAGAGKMNQLKYHCLDKKERQPSHEEYDSAKNKGVDPAAGRAALAALPVNTWAERKPSLNSAERRWGFYGAYDVRTHKTYAWGGGHGGYQGADVTEYDLLRNRWIGMIDPPAYKHPWRHKGSGDSPPGLTYNGCILIQSHGRKSHGVDPLTNSVVTSHGDVYSIADRCFAGFIGRCPGRWNLGDQVGYVTAPHGLYGFTGRGGKGNKAPAVYRANVAAGKWDLVAADPDGPTGHSEANPMTYDSKRDAILYFRVRPRIEAWSFSFKKKKWTKHAPAGKLPTALGGDPAYVPELDAALFIYSTGRGKPARLFLYKVGEKKWWSAQLKGDEPGSGYWLNNSMAWDPKLKLLVHVSSSGRDHWIKVLVMRPDFKTLKLTPIGK